jgi:hypothetical protein
MFSRRINSRLLKVERDGKANFRHGFFIAFNPVSRRKRREIEKNKGQIPPSPRRMLRTIFAPKLKS